MRPENQPKKGLEEIPCTKAIRNMLARSFGITKVFSNDESTKNGGRIVLYVIESHIIKARCATA